MQHRYCALEGASADAARGAGEDAYETCVALTGEVDVGLPDCRELHHARRWFGRGDFNAGA